MVLPCIFNGVGLQDDVSGLADAIKVVGNCGDDGIGGGAEVDAESASGGASTGGPSNSMGAGGANASGGGQGGDEAEGGQGRGESGQRSGGEEGNGQGNGGGGGDGGGGEPGAGGGAAAGPRRCAIHVRYPWAQLLLLGVKTEEMKTWEMGNHSRYNTGGGGTPWLQPGVDLWLIETPPRGGAGLKTLKGMCAEHAHPFLSSLTEPPKRARVIGGIRFDASFAYTSEAHFRAAERRHCIATEGPMGWGGEETAEKHGWRVSNTEWLTEPAEPPPFDMKARDVVGVRTPFAVTSAIAAALPNWQLDGRAGNDGGAARAVAGGDVPPEVRAAVAAIHAGSVFPMACPFSCAPGGCKVTRTSCLNMLNHIRTDHAQQKAVVDGTVLLETANKERKRNREKSKAEAPQPGDSMAGGRSSGSAAAPAPGHSAPQGAKGQRRAGISAVEQALDAAPAFGDSAPQVAKETGRPGKTTRPKACAPSGDVGAGGDASGFAGARSGSGGRSSGSLSLEGRGGAKRGADGATASARKRKGNAARPAGPAISPLQVMGAEAGPSHAEFLRSLPTVNIHPEFLGQKYEACLRTVRSRQSWPVKTWHSHKTSSLEAGAFRNFRDYMTNTKKLQEGAADRAVLDMMRIAHMLEVDGQRITTEEAAASPKWLVAVRVSGLDQPLINHDIFDAKKYTWPEQMKNSCGHYITYMLQQLERAKEMASEVPYLDKMASALQCLKTALDEGLTKKNRECRQGKLAKRATEDFHRYQQLPPRPEIRLAIRRAQVELQDINRRTRREGRSMDDKEMDIALADVVCIIFLDGFAGRPGEWQKLTRRAIQEFLASDRDFFTVSEHKTALVYGELAKYIAPPVREAIACFAGLPRRDSPDLFLTGRSGMVVSLSRVLHMACRRHFPDAATARYFTPTLLRKAFHSALIKLTSTEEKMLKVLEILDGHRPDTARKHYVLRDPSHDAKLGKALRDAVFGPPVPWSDATALFRELAPVALPNQDETGKKHRFENIDIAALVDFDFPGAGEEEEAEEEEELPGWEFGHMFGHCYSLLAIEDAPAEALPLEDSPPAAALMIADSPQAEIPITSGVSYCPKLGRFARRQARGAVRFVHDSPPRKRQKTLEEAMRPSHGLPAAASAPASASAAVPGPSTPPQGEQHQITRTRLPKDFAKRVYEDAAKAFGPDHEQPREDRGGIVILFFDHANAWRFEYVYTLLTDSVSCRRVCS